MAFGGTLKDKKQTDGIGDAKTFEPFWLDTHSGVRIFRILPMVDEFGKMIVDKHGRGQPENEIAWLEAWWPVNVGGNLSKRRIMFDPTKRWNNPLWKYIEEHFDKEARERKVFKQKFGINVYSKTPVVYDDDGKKVYMNEKNVFIITAMGKELPKPVVGTPEPENKILVLEGSSGQVGGKHLLQDFVDLAGEVDSPIYDGTLARLHEFDIRLKTTGSQLEIRRKPYHTTNVTPLDDSIVVLPRYDLANWTKPWPDDAITQLLEGVDFNEVVETYKIRLFPALVAPQVEVSPTEKENKKPGKKSTKPVEDDENLFDD